MTPLLRRALMTVPSLGRAADASERRGRHDLRQRLADSEGAASSLPHREKYLRLVIEFLRDLLDLHEQLVDEVERELTPKTSARSRQSA